MVRFEFVNQGQSMVLMFDQQLNVIDEIIAKMKELLIESI